MACEIIFPCLIAKYNAEMYYAVIGLVEDIETSLCVMEAYVPLFFKGALKVYYEIGRYQAKQSKILKTPISFVANVTPHKDTISDLARSILATNMTLDYEFYGFVKHRLKMQVESLRKQKHPMSLCGGKPIGGRLNVTSVNPDEKEGKVHKLKQESLPTITF